ncbi:MAG: DNA-binding protein [Bacteroidales bacterium]|nr:DNA-binding protein [Bacteroidales bacterium]
MMKYQNSKHGERYILSIANHEDLTAAITAFCKEKDIKCGAIYGLGAISSLTLRYYSPVTKQYVDKTFNEQMEISNLTGNISSKDGEVYLHLHVTCGRADYTCIGGHMLTATISGACELVVEPFPGQIGRYLDSEDTGLNLYKF